jgi:hypothetical protein
MWPHAPDRWQPSVHRRNDVAGEDAVSRLRRLGDGGRIPGLPDSFPLACAALMPALVRSEISARSSCATAPRTWRENMPWGVEVSMGSRKERKWAPLSSNRSMTSRMSLLLSDFNLKRLAKSLKVLEWAPWGGQGSGR